MRLLIIFYAVSSLFWCHADAAWQYYAKNIVNPQLPRHTASYSTIRVLLSSIDSAGDHVYLTTEKYFIVRRGTTKKKYTSPLLLTCHNGTFTCNGDAFDAQQGMSIEVSQGYICCGENQYCGSIQVIKQADSLLIINCLNLEDYVYAVLKTESWPTWSLAMNKVMAIAVRTYAVAMMMQAQRCGGVYDLSNTNQHQTYTGNHVCAVRKKAVQQTKDIVICYDGLPILAMYDTCCAGVVPAKTKHFNIIDKPYLARSYACTYCKTSSFYNWDTVISIKQLQSQLHLNSPLNSVKLFYDDSGLIDYAQFNFKGCTKKLSASQLYGLDKSIQSYKFRIEKKSKHLIIEGYGIGHHIGLCQWGAHAMIQKGFSYQRTLLFYYPGTYLKSYKLLAI